MTTTPFTTLTTFRSQLYQLFSARQDALLDLVDALLTAGPRPALVHLSLAPPRRRGWGSLYAALREGQIDVPALRKLIRNYPLATPRPIYAVDVSVWPRCEAETSAERGFYYHPSRHLNGLPVVKGWAYQWIAQVGLARDSWTAPLDVQRLLPSENATAVAITQIKALLPDVPTGAPYPIFLLDAGYDATTLAHELATGALGLLIRRFCCKNRFLSP